jgi:hypothetical protein
MKQSAVHDECGQPLQPPQLAAPLGVLTAPQFGKSLALNSFFGTNNAANRSISFRSQF